jgi:hypothetical protein
MRRVKLFVLIVSVLMSLAVAGPVAGGHGGPHEQPLPAAACNAGTAQARTLVPGPLTAQPGRRIPHIHHLVGEPAPGCYHFNEQFPPATFQ